jgi:hypothetical protein
VTPRTAPAQREVTLGTMVAAVAALTLAIVVRFVI